MAPSVLSKPELLPSRKRFLRLFTQHPRVPVVGQKSAPGLDPARLYAALFAGEPQGYLLESGTAPSATERFSILGAGRGRVLCADSRGARILDPDQKIETGSPLALLDRLNFNSQEQTFDYLPHFWGGWVGYFGYETVRWLEPVILNKTDDLDVPDIFLMETGPLLVYDHTCALLKCIVPVESGGNAESAWRRAVQTIESLWERIDSVLAEALPPMADSVPQHTALAGFVSNFERDQYQRIVHRAQDYIREGDIYQANLAQRFEAEFRGTPLSLYRRLRSVNPSPFGGMIQLPNAAIVSSSPERLVKVESGWIETRPIAGTRPRDANPEEDTRLSAELLLNEKERAEHLMLVDLERNDLGRLCEYGSVSVTDLMFLERYSHVHHIVSNIRGRLKENVSFPDILKAVFPGGTITGCPKIRCMEIIEELETVRRGPYCGSFGYIGYGPYLDLNIIIRTLLLKQHKAYFHVGAGIVADSVAEREYEETLTKAAAMMLALSPKKR